MHSPCTTVDFTFNASDVGIPDTVGSSMGMAYVVTEMSALSTNCTFCHDFAPPCIFYPGDAGLARTFYR